MRVQGQPGLHNVALSQNKRRKQTLVGGQAAPAPASAMKWSSQYRGRGGHPNVSRTTERVRNRPADSLFLILITSLPLSLYSHVDTKELCGKYLDLQPPRCGQDYPEVGKAVWAWVGLVGGPQGEAGILCDP